MKRPVINKDELNKHLKNKPVILVRIYAFLMLLLSPILLTLHLWISEWSLIKDSIEELIDHIMGEYK